MNVLKARPFQCIESNGGEKFCNPRNGCPFEIEKGYWVSYFCAATSAMHLPFLTFYNNLSITYVILIKNLFEKIFLQIWLLEAFEVFTYQGALLTF